MKEQTLEERADNCVKNNASESFRANLRKYCPFGGEVQCDYYGLRGKHSCGYDKKGVIRLLIENMFRGLYKQ